MPTEFHVEKKIPQSKAQALACLIYCNISPLGNKPLSVASYCSYQNSNKTSNKPTDRRNLD